LGGLKGVIAGHAKISEIMKALPPEYQAHYRQRLRQSWQGHAWWANAFCLPDSLLGVYQNTGASYHFMADPTLVLISAGRPGNMFRVIYTDGRGFLPEDRQAPQWYGESRGFWDGDELVIHTKNYRGWENWADRPETSDQLETIERMKRIGDDIVIDMTLYDPKAFAFPWHDVAIFHTARQNWLDAPQVYDSCVFTNNVHLTADGSLDQYGPGDAGYRDATDKRPWATAYELWAKHHPDLDAAWDAAFKRDEEASRRK
jgi:hypothetical protein